MSQERKYRVLISGGGTGGHIFPAIAIADALKAKLPMVEILFVGALGRMEMEKVPKAGYEILGLPIMGIQRRLTLKNLMVPFKLIKSLWKARQIVKTFQPNVAVGVGGYASGPTLRAASWQGIPTILQEQNSFAGVTNKMLAKGASKICVAYDGMERFFPSSKIVHTGNPIRQSIREQASVDRSAAYKHFQLDPNKKTVLVVGGSLGARSINQAVEACKPLIDEHKNQVQWIWQTGKLYYEKYKGHEGDHIRPMAFITRMDYAYAAADFVVSRAGALSISELCVIGKPAILIPSPNVSEDHQTHNAMSLVRKGAAVMIKDNEAKDLLGKQVMELVDSPEESEKLSEQIQKLAKPEADQAIVDQILEVIS